jgi:hypothetical protein
MRIGTSRRFEIWSRPILAIYVLFIACPTYHKQQDSRRDPMGCLGFILDTPAESSKEGVQKIDADPGFWITLGEIVALVLFELSDEGFDIIPE